MIDREAELGIVDARALASVRRSTTTSRRLTFCRQFMRAVFSWPTKQPLVKLTPFSSAALHSSQRMSPSSARPSQTPRRRRCSSQPVAGSSGRTEPASSKLRQAADRGRLRRFRRPVHGKRRIALDADRPAQAVDRQPLDQIVGSRRFAVEQQVLAVGPDDEVEQALALRRQQPGPDRQRAR